MFSLTASSLLKWCNFFKQQKFAFFQKITKEINKLVTKEDCQISIMIEEDWGGMSAGKRCKPETGELTVALGWAQVCYEVLGSSWNLSAGKLLVCVVV